MARSGPGPTIGRPSIVSVPAVGCTSPAIAFRKVVLPQPLGPTIARNSPAVTLRVRSCRARSRERSARFSYAMVTWLASSTAGMGCAPSERLALQDAELLQLCAQAGGLGPPQRRGRQARLGGRGGPLR